MKSRTHYLWLKNFWDDLLHKRARRRWVVATLVDGEVALRDGFAHALVRERLYGRSDVTYQFLHAWRAHDATPLDPDCDLVLLGRPKPFSMSRFSQYAHLLEKNTCGSFIDPPDGRTGHAIRYVNGTEKRVLSCRELDEPLGRYRRCDLDYGILLYRCEWIDKKKVTLVAIGGLGMLGTLGLATVLWNDTCRARLVEQLQQLAPWKSSHHPERWFELCVRIEVDGEARLTNLLNDLATRGPLNTLQFQVEAFAVPTGGGKTALHLRQPAETELKLKPEAGDGHGGWVRTSEARNWVKLPKKRFHCLLCIVTRPDEATVEGLCEHLGFKPLKGKPAKGRLAKLVHDLNESLCEQVLDIRGRRRPITYRARKGRYVLDGIRGSIVGDQLSSAADIG